jgi:hypothetical protein
MRLEIYFDKSKLYDQLVISFLQVIESIYLFGKENFAALEGEVTE